MAEVRNGFLPPFCRTQEGQMDCPTKEWMDVVMEGNCPDCGGELDEGFECNNCGTDAFPGVQEYWTQFPPRGIYP